jgi:tetratricopeptide (TPR) repeat protein
MGQSRADEALPLLDDLLINDRASKPEIARAARLYASAMYLLNRDSAVTHGAMAERAVQVSRECGDKELLAHALFECGRAGVESGRVEMTRVAREELRREVMSPRAEAPPIALYADAYCSYFLLDIEEALESAQGAVARLVNRKNIGELALAYNALGNCEMARCQLDKARHAYRLALGLWSRVGDDCRVSLTAWNLAATHLMGGEVEEAIRIGEESLTIGRRAPTQPGLQRTFAGLALAYILQGRTTEALECREWLRRWMQNGRSWAVKMEYSCEAAEIELAIGNEGEALRLIAQAEQQFQERGYLFINQGTLERLRVFLAYHTQGPDVASQLAEEFVSRFRSRHQLAYLEVVAAIAWIERKVTGNYSAATERELSLFEELRATGKRALLAAQGFLT